MSASTKTLLTAIAAVASAVLTALLLAEGLQAREHHSVVRLEAAQAPGQNLPPLPQSEQAAL